MTFPVSGSRIELNAINQILASVGQAPVTTIESDGDPAYPTNPDVAIAFDTLMQVSREVQAEGWTFNKEYHFPVSTDANNEIPLSDSWLQIDATRDQGRWNNQNEMTNSHVVKKSYQPDPVMRNGKVYDRANHTYKWNQSPINFDILWLIEFDYIPPPIRNYIIAKASTRTCINLLGDTAQFQLLQQNEAYTRAMAIEYDCNQGDYTYFGHPAQGDYYVSYQPFHALRR